MLDMGFIHDVRARDRACCRSKRQTLFFSATMPPEIAGARRQHPAQPGDASRSRRPSTTAEKVEQEVFFVEKADKRALLVDVLRDTGDDARARLHAHQARRRTGSPSSSPRRGIARRGDPRQQVAERARARARELQERARSACWSRPTSRRAASTSTTSRTSSTSICPNVPETYVHRIGRTARAGAGGIAISFCDAEERAVPARHREADQVRIPVVEHPWQPRPGAPKAAAAGRPSPARSNGGRPAGTGARVSRPAGETRTGPRRSGAPARGRNLRAG